jgi:site-specific DNA-methyltransferase (adenine-specific)
MRVWTKKKNLKMDKVMFSFANDVWATPQEFFDALDREFCFTLDACALPENAKCKRYFTPQTGGLVQDWQEHTVLCNPPYGRKITAWVEKCYRESCKPGTKVVLLIPARTDTSYFHRFIYKIAKEIRFVKGRLKFGNSRNSAPFPSMVVVF